MKKFNEYVKMMVEKCEVTKDDLQDDFHFSSIGDFLALSVEKYYKNDRLLSFFKTIQSGVNEGANREEVIEYLATTRQGYEKARLQNNPVNFSTNPMLNLMRLWDFELLAEYIKYTGVMLSKI
jgi:hypothetical protein